MTMKPDEMDRRDIVKVIAAAGSVALLPITAAAAPYQPKFLSAGEFEQLATLAELVIPQTDTPGARAARVHELIDLVLSEETPAVQKRFRDGLVWVDQRSRAAHLKKFLDLAAQQQTAILTTMSAAGNAGHEFFLEFRRRTVFAYYTSEIGLHQELNYQGHQVLDRWPGCPHPDHHGDEA